jgi:glycine/D-amino acid oxidase-like deaminating enzyme
MLQTVFERQPPSPEVIQASLAATKFAPFWLDDLTERPSYPRLSGETRAELAIVGGGLVGLWTALLAKERNPDAEVILLEARQLGWAASGRNGGFCEASLTHGEKNGQRRWPEEFETLHAMGLANLDEMEATIHKYQIECDFERTGELVVAVEPHQDAGLHGEGYLDQQQVRAEVNSPTFLSGNWDRQGTAMLNPAKLVVGLARVASMLGVRLYEESAVEQLSQLSRETTRLTTGHGQVDASRVILATNVFPSLLKRYRLHTLPVYDYALMTEPLNESQLAAIGWHNRQGLADTANQFHYYRITRDNRILFGGYDALYYRGGQVKEEYDARPASFERLASHFFTTFPQLAGLKFSHQWGGAIDTSTRFCAFFGHAHGGRVAYAAGFTGLGVGASRFAANVLLDRVYGLDTERTRLRMVRQRALPFPPEPIAYPVVRLMQWCLDRADHQQGRRNWFLRLMDKLGLGFES